MCVVTVLWTEIADDRCRLKDIMSEFSEQEKSYEEQRRRHIAQQQRVKKEERKAAAEAQQQEMYGSLSSCVSVVCVFVSIDFITI